MGEGDRSKGQVWGSGYGWGIPAAVLILGLVATAMLFWVWRISERQKLNFEQVDAVMDMQIKTAVFHVWFEEAIVDGASDELKKLLPDLDDAMKLSHALLHGGLSEHGTPLLPFADPRFRLGAEVIGSRLAQLKEIALKRSEDPKAGGVGSPLDEQFDAVFGEFMEAARALEVLAENTQASDYAKTRPLLFLIFVTWAVIVVTATVGLYSRERRRRWAEWALERAHEESEQRVRDRTSELADANRQLQKEIAERLQAEAALRESEEGLRRLLIQFRTLLETIPDSITLISRDLRVLWANRVPGAPAPEGTAAPAGEYCYTLWHRGSAPCNECPAVTSFVTGKAGSARIFTPDGRHWEVRSVPITSADGAVESVLEVASDITEKMKFHAETMRAAHLASLGEISAGVAHEINNPVNGIINCAQILWDKSLAGSREHDLAARILKERGRIGEIVRGLLAFARERKEEKRPVDLEEILSESLALTRSQMTKEGIELMTAVPSDLPKIVANPQQIQQVFMNIISNARYALNEKYPGSHENKVLEIRAERVAVEGTTVVRISFSDRGTGIAPHLIHKVMEPFFSTKPSSKGTGLGLSISHGIVSDHGGRLAMESVEGEFTRVVIDLPARKEGDG